MTDYLTISTIELDNLPAFLRDAIEGAKARAGVSQLPAALLREVDRPGADLVVMTAADFSAWIAGGELLTSANTQYRAALGDEAAAAWLDTLAPDWKE